MGRPKQRWQDQERLQDQEEKMLVDLNRSSQEEEEEEDDDDDDDDSNVNIRTGITLCNFAIMCVSAFVHSFRNLSYDRSVAPSKTSSPQSAI